MDQVEDNVSTVSEAGVDSKLSALQNKSLGKGETVIEYSNRILELVTNLEFAEHAM